MRRRQKIRVCLATAFAALLHCSACTTIEHRSESVPPAPLPAVSKSAPQIHSPLWQQSLGSRHRCKQQGLGFNLGLRDKHIFVADCEGHVWSLDAEKGQVLWKRRLKTPITAGPSVSENLLVVTSKRPAMVALNRDTGALVWEQPEQHEILTPVSFASGKVFSHALDDTVTARRVKDGSLVWQIQNPPLNLVLRKNAPPIPTGKNVLLGFADGKLIAFKQATGEVAWMQELSLPAGHDEFQRMVDLSAAPVVSGDRVFAVNFQGKLNAFQAESGEKRWSYPVSSFSGLTVQNNRVVVSDTQGILLALDKKTGKKQWMQAGLKGRRLSAPAAADAYIFVGDEQGQLHVLRLATGEYLTRIKVSAGAIEAAPVVAGKRLFVLSQGTVVSAYYLGDLKDDVI